MCSWRCVRVKAVSKVKVQGVGHMIKTWRHPEFTAGCSRKIIDFFSLSESWMSFWANRKTDERITDHREDRGL